MTITDSLGCELSEMAEVQGPNIYMGPGNDNICTGYFYDSGGPNGSFNSNENFVYTICSDAPDLSSAISFYAFDLGGSFWSSPVMIIYDGGLLTHLYCIHTMDLRPSTRKHCCYRQ